MTHIYLIIFSVLIYSFSVIFQRILLSKDNNDPIIFSLFFQYLTAFIIYIYALFTNQLQWHSVINVSWNLLYLAVLYGIGNGLIFISLQKIEASKFSILFATRGIFTISGAAVLFGEFLSKNQFIGAILIFLGILIVNYQKNNFKIKYNDLYAVAAGLLFGLANLNDRILLNELNLYQYTILGFLFPAIFTSIIYFKRLYLIKNFITDRKIISIFGLSICYSISALTFFGALQIAPVSSQIIAINLTSTILIAVLGIIFLKERSNIFSKILGAIISMIGLLLVS